jgi:hypothetical protein
MILFIKLLLAHLIGDFMLQPNAWVQQKEIKKLKAWQLYMHIFIHGAFTLLLLWNRNDWPVVLWVMLTHFVIDVIKLYFQKEAHRTLWFVSDQIMHFVSLLIIALCWSHFNRDIISENIWIYLCAVLFLTVAMPVIMRILLQKWADNIGLTGDNSLNNAGKYIGILERLLVFVFIMAGHWEAVGFLITAKSVFRFSDLKESKDRKLTEYILIGTLLSFGIAILTAMMTQLAITLA